ncbi:hypothetical protein Pmar_PMAR012671, partial [Perkinsus marinus ATCC 50983]
MVVTKALAKIDEKTHETKEKVHACKHDSIQGTKGYHLHGSGAVWARTWSCRWEIPGNM